MSSLALQVRPSSLADLAAIDRLLARSYSRLLAADYPPSSLVLAVPRFARARPELLQSGRYLVVEDRDGRIVAAGGWSRSTPGGGMVDGITGHVRHVATDPALARQGVGRVMMTRVMDDARNSGIGRLDCLSTITAVPFYQALGFQMLGPGRLPLGIGIDFPVIRMTADLRQG